MNAGCPGGSYRHYTGTNASVVYIHTCCFLASLDLRETGRINAWWRDKQDWFRRPQDQRRGTGASKCTYVHTIIKSYIFPSTHIRLRAPRPSRRNRARCIPCGTTAAVCYVGTEYIAEQQGRKVSEDMRCPLLKGPHVIGGNRKQRRRPRREALQGPKNKEQIKGKRSLRA